MNVGDLVTPTGRLVMTAEAMAEDRAGWLALRRGHDDVPGFYCIGSSDTSGILGIAFGVEKSGTPVKTWLEKVRGIESPDNQPMMWGRLHESTIGDYWQARNRSVTRNVGLIGNINEPWHQTSLDRLVLECPLDRGIKEMCALEIKNRNAFGMRRWHAELPDDVLAQLCHQIYTTGLDHLHWAVLVGGSSYRQGVIRRIDHEDTITYVIDRCNSFRQNYLQYGNEIEPPWDQDMAAQTYLELDAAKYPDRTGVKDTDDIGDVLEIAKLRAKKNLYTRLEKAQKVALYRDADGSRSVTFAGELAYEFHPRVKWSINQERLAERYPEAWNDPEIRVKAEYWQLELAPAFKATTAEEDDE